MQKHGWIGVDLDACLAHYDHWRGPTHIGAPISAMVSRVKRYLSEGREVRIFTARVSTRNQLELDLIRQSIAAWTLEHIGVALIATCVKDTSCLYVYDDRCRQVEPNTGRIIGELELA